jgi:hypothetical protein
MKWLILNNIYVFLSSARIIESILKQLGQYQIESISNEDLQNQIELNCEVPGNTQP